VTAFRDNSAPFAPGPPDEPARIPIEENPRQLRRRRAGRDRRSQSDEAEAAARALGGEVWVVKAQVHAGGRGKAGGVKLARNLDEVSAAAAGMLGNGWSRSRPAPRDCRSSASMSRPVRTSRASCT
jgi:hypothetical protein